MPRPSIVLARQFDQPAGNADLHILAAVLVFDIDPEKSRIPKVLFINRLEINAGRYLRHPER